MITDAEYQDLIDKIHYLERENELLKEQIELYKKILAKESQFIPQFVPVPYPGGWNPATPIVTYHTGTDYKFE